MMRLCHLGYIGWLLLLGSNQLSLGQSQVHCQLCEGAIVFFTNSSSSPSFWNWIGLHYSSTLFSQIIANPHLAILRILLSKMIENTFLVCLFRINMAIHWISFSSKISRMFLMPTFIDSCSAKTPIFYLFLGTSFKKNLHW